MRIYIFILFCFCGTAYAQQTDEKSQNSQEATTANNSGFLLLQSEQYKEAILQFEKAIALDPMQIIYYYNLADACVKSKDYMAALRVYSDAKRYHPSEADLYMYTGDLLQNQNKLKEAISEYDKGISLVKDDNPLKYLFYFNRGNSYLKLKDFTPAIHNYTSTLNELPNFYGAYANRGMAYYNLKRKAEACSDWRKAAINGYTLANQYISAYCK